MKKEKVIKLGTKCRETITGFTGIVVAITDWINGCRRITLQPQELHDGKPIETHTFDVQQIEEIEANPKIIPADRPGGPRIEPKRNRDPK